MNPPHAQGAASPFLRYSARSASWARRKGHSSLTLITFRHLPWNAPFYEKLGFVRLRSAELSAGLAKLIEAEGEAGIDVARRIGMRLTLAESATG